MTATVVKYGIRKTKVIPVVVTRLGANPVISSIANITTTVNLNGEYSMPSKLDATMSDGTTKKVAVIWSPSYINTTTQGVITCQGTVTGYASKVILNVTVVFID